MSETPYKVTDRRPIKARSLPIFQTLAAKLAAVGVSGNAISIASIFFGLAAGAAIALTPFVNYPLVRGLWLVGTACIQLRLVANLLDGMVAIASGKASAVGELFNEVPDRISDSAALIGLGYAAGATPALGWLAALMAVMTAYIRGIGKSSGAGADFSGPMAKQQRMFVVTMLCLFCALVPQSWQQWRQADIALSIIILGSALTACRRLAHIAKKLKEKA